MYVPCGCVPALDLKVCDFWSKGWKGERESWIEYVGQRHRPGDADDDHYFRKNIVMARLYCRVGYKQQAHSLVLVKGCRIVGFVPFDVLRKATWPDGQM